MRQRAPVAVFDAPASGRLAVAEAVTNILAATLLASPIFACPPYWMAACGEPGEDATSMHGRAVGVELCASWGSPSRW